jgi:hypothetical protein
MAEGYKNEIASVGITNIHVPVGLTVATLVASEANQSYLSIKALVIGANATLIMFGLPAGATVIPAATLNAITGWGLAASEVVSLKGHPAVYLACTGATCTVSVLKGYGDNPGVVLSPA